MSTFLRLLSASLLAVSLAGCGFWGGKSDEIEPNKLVSFKAEKKVDVLWSVSVGSGPGNKFHQLTPAIDDERIFAVDKKGTVFAYQLESGKKLWNVKLKQAIVGGVGAGNAKVAVATEEGEVIVLSAEDGSELWRANVGSEVTAPGQFNRELAVFQLVNGKVIAFDAVTGEQRWAYDSLVPRLTLRGTSTPIVASDVTFAGFASGKLVAIDNTKGTALWESRVALPEGRTELERMVDVDGQPLFVDGTLYATSFQGRLAAINPFRAQILWTQDVSSHRSLAAGFGNLYVSEADGAVQAFDRSTSASVWRQADLANRSITSPAVVGSSVAVADYQGYIHFMSQTDGHFVARYRADSGGVNGDMLVRDDVLYVLGNKGRLVALTLQ